MGLESSFSESAAERHAIHLKEEKTNGLNVDFSLILFSNLI
jgi:hypothetical protein